MTATLSLKNSINNVYNFINDITGSNNSYFMFISKPNAWTYPNGSNADSNPPPANMSIQSIELDITDNIIYGKQITNSDISILIPNNLWASNTIYNNYSTNDPNYYLNTYVVTDANNVYKCLDNNNGSASIIKPSIISTSGSFQTSDGYTWKYMYTITSSNFTSSLFVPVVSNTYVVNSAIPGTIDVIRILNGGYNWQGYHTGYLQSVQNQESVIIAANAVNIDNFYTGSSLYLKAGLGADQIRPIINYSGTNKIATVYPPFSIYSKLQLDNSTITGSIYLGQTLNQSIANISYIYGTGIINKNDNLIQTDTNVKGVVTSSNASFISLGQVNNIANVSPNNPFYNSTYSPTSLTGTITINTNSNTVIGVTANLLTLSVGEFIQVGSITNNNIRRITSITNSTYANVASPFNNTLIANNFNMVSHVFEPYTIATSNNFGTITQLNLNSMKILYGNISSNTTKFILGETVKEYDANNIDQSCNGVISYSNSTAVIISNINGIINLNNFLVGQSSNIKAQIENIVSYPSATVSNVIGTFLIGQPLFASYGNGVISGSANLLSYSLSPGSATEYVISPTVNITGDGSNALAYSVVNNQIGSNFPIEDVIILNNGTQFTLANVNITANTLYGLNAVLEPVISPLSGHGYNAVKELGGKYVGIAKTFDTSLNENYYFPTSASYRQVGIIKNPLFNNLYVNYGNLKRQKLTIQTIQNSFVNNEIIFQYSSQAAAKVVYASNTLLEISDINGTFTSNAIVSGNNMIVGLTSNSLANVVLSTFNSFNIISNNQPVYESNTNVSGILNQVINSSMIVLSNVNSKFISNVNIYDPTNNTYANVIALYTSNGQTLSTTFGQKFNQTSRIAIYSNSSNFFVNGERVTQQFTNANGIVLDISQDLDLSIKNVTGYISTGTLLTDSNTNANGIILFSNNTYLKLTGVVGTFNKGDTISCLSGNAIVNSVYNVITVYNLQDSINFQYNYNITGNSSGAAGYSLLSNTISYPDIVKNSGEVIYLNNIQPFTTNLNSKEVFLTILSF